MSISTLYGLVAVLIFVCISTVGVLLGIVVPNGQTIVYIGALCFGMMTANLWLVDIAYSLRKMSNRGFTIKKN